MEQLLLLMILAGGIQAFKAFILAADSECNLNQNISLCSATVGGAVNIQLISSAIGLRVECRKKFPNESRNVFSLKRGKVKVDEAFRNKTEFYINNGTLKVTNVQRSDSGQYTVDIYKSDGMVEKKMTFNLEVKENIHHILIPVCIGVAALLIVVLCCCVFRKRKSCRKSGT